MILKQLPPACQATLRARSLHRHQMAETTTERARAGNTRRCARWRAKNRKRAAQLARGYRARVKARSSGT